MGENQTIHCYFWETTLRYGFYPQKKYANFTKPRYAGYSYTYIYQLCSLTSPICISDLVEHCETLANND